VVGGDRVRPRPEIKPSSIKKLLKKCARDRSLRGRRDLAMLFVLYVAGVAPRRALTFGILSTFAMVNNGAWERYLLAGWVSHIRGAQCAENALKKWICVRGKKPGPLFVAIRAE